MNINRVFQVAAETRLLERLSEQEKVCFAGDAEAVDYIRLHPALHGRRRAFDFVALKSGSAVPTAPFKGRVVVAVSTRDEQALSARLRAAWVGTTVLCLFSDVLVNLLAQLELLGRAPRAEAFPNRCYAIITTPRSGSTLLSQLLASTGVAGYPQEHLRLATQTLSCECGFDYVRLLRILAATRATPNGVFGTKLIMHFLEKHQAQRESFEAVARAFKFIKLVRVDRVAQAVSLHLARATGIWHLHDDRTRRIYDEKIGAIRIDQRHIDGVRAMYNEICREEALMVELFDRWRIAPMLVKYEQLMAYPEVEIGRVTDFLGIDEPYNHQAHRTTSKRLRSNINKGLADAYRQEYGSD